MDLPLSSGEKGTYTGGHNLKIHSLSLTGPSVVNSLVMCLLNLVEIIYLKQYFSNFCLISHVTILYVLVFTKTKHKMWLHG